MKRFILIVAIFCLCLSISACLGTRPTGHKPAGYGWYTVKPTDTLYSIAWRYGLDYKELARWNSVAIDAIINPGQRLVLIKPNKYLTPKVISMQVENKVATKKKVTTASKTVAFEPGNKNPQSWQWPIKGKVLNTFSSKQLDRRGIDIAGKLGQSVRATANGKVVYSGNGLAGYGNLIIVKHSDTFLSAYAYCKERLVSEGMSVKAGSIIAKVGLHKNKSAVLHFEVRKNGKPVDPLQYLARQ